MESKSNKFFDEFDPSGLCMKGKFNKFLDEVDPVGLFFYVGLGFSVLATVLNILGWA